MRYEGNNENKLNCEQFIKNECYIEKFVDRDAIEINLYVKGNNENIATIICFFYNHKNPYDYSAKSDSMHIKKLGVVPQFSKKGIATYLVKEVLSIVESEKLKHVSVHPSASTFSISQDALEAFYRKFSFKGLFNRDKEIEFKIVSD